MVAAHPGVILEAARRQGKTVLRLALVEEDAMAAFFFHFAQGRGLPEAFAEAHVGEVGGVQVYAQGKVVELGAESSLVFGHARREQGYLEAQLTQERGEEAV